MGGRVGMCGWAGGHGAQSPEPRDSELPSATSHRNSLAACASAVRMCPLAGFHPDRAHWHCPSCPSPSQLGHTPLIAPPSPGSDDTRPAQRRHTSRRPSARTAAAGGQGQSEPGTATVPDSRGGGGCRGVLVLTCPLPDENAPQDRHFPVMGNSPLPSSTSGAASPSRSLKQESVVT